LRPVGSLAIGHTHPSVLGPDVSFMVKPSGKNSYTTYIPGSSVKGALRSAASRVAEAYGFSSCGKAVSKYLLDCEVCGLFGKENTLHPKIFFSDFIPENGVVKFVRTSIKLRDKSLTAEEHALFNMERITHQTVFTGRIEFYNLNYREMTLLLLALAELRLGRFGRASSVDVMIENVQEIEHLVPNEYSGMLRYLGDWLWI